MHILYRYPFCKVKYIVHIHKLMALNEKGHREQKNSKNAMLNTNQEMRQLQMIACHFIKKWSSSDESQEPNFTKIWKWYDTMALVLVVVVFAVVEFGSYELLRFFQWVWIGGGGGHYYNLPISHFVNIYQISELTSDCLKSNTLLSTNFKLSKIW